MTAILDLINDARDALALDRLTSIEGTTQAARRALGLINDAGREICAHYGFQALRSIETIATVDGTAGYAKPAGFHAIVDDTLWDFTNDQKILHATPAMWIRLQAGVNVSGIQSWFRILGDEIVIFPTPSSVRTLKYEMRSRHWVNVGGLGVDTDARVDNDDDEVRFDEDLMRLSLKWRVRRQSGWDYGQEEQDYRDALELAVARDHPTGPLFQTGAPGGFRLLDESDIPDSGF